jgi:hypothetical protein
MDYPPRKRQFADGAPSPLIEQHLAVDHREDRPIAANAYVFARTPARTPLTTDDATGLGELAAIQLDAQHLRVRVTAIAARALSFFMSH